MAAQRPTQVVAPDAEPEVAEPITGDGITGNDRANYDNDLMATERALKAQPKVVVKLAEDTTVCINGHRMLIKGKTKVQVPEQVADLLEEAGRI